MTDDDNIERPVEYEPPVIVALGSVDEVTAGRQDSDSVTTSTNISDARLKTDIAVVANAVGRLHQL